MHLLALSILETTAIAIAILTIVILEIQTMEVERMGQGTITPHSLHHFHHNHPQRQRGYHLRINHRAPRVAVAIPPSRPLPLRLPHIRMVVFLLQWYPCKAWVRLQAGRVRVCLAQ